MTEMSSQHLSHMMLHSFPVGLIQREVITVVQSVNDPCSNMWSGPVQYSGNIWPTTEHVIVGVKQEKSSFLPINKIPAIVMEYCPASYKAKQFGKDISIAQQIHHWYAIRRKHVHKILLYVALNNTDFLYCLPDPLVKTSNMSCYFQMCMTSRHTHDRINMATILERNVKPSSSLLSIFIITCTIPT